MPIYEYECQQCGRKFEYFLRSGGDEKKVKCPKCGAENQVCRFVFFHQIIQQFLRHAQLRLRIKLRQLALSNQDKIKLSEPGQMFNIKCLPRCCQRQLLDAGFEILNNNN